jgi:hypothetical protein
VRDVCVVRTNSDHVGNVISQRRHLLAPKIPNVLHEMVVCQWLESIACLGAGRTSNSHSWETPP